MTTVSFFAANGGITGFEISGHSTQGCDDIEGKLLCSAVSSAAYMAANTITDVIGDSAEIKVEDGYMRLECKALSAASQKVLAGLKLHLKELSLDYKNNLRIITEV